MKIVFMVEEMSMKTLLDAILPRILPEEINFIVIPHQGKSDLQNSIPNKLRGWNEPDVRFVVVHDQDSMDCKVLKKKLQSICNNSGRKVLIRIACVELEAWYLGDWDALAKAYGRPELLKNRNKSKYRNPDQVQNPKYELRKLIPEHQQITGARKVGPVMNLNKNTSESFNQFLSGVQRLVMEVSHD